MIKQSLGYCNLTLSTDLPAFWVGTTWNSFFFFPSHFEYCTVCTCIWKSIQILWGLCKLEVGKLHAYMYVIVVGIRQSWKTMVVAP